MNELISEVEKLRVKLISCKLNNHITIDKLVGHIRNFNEMLEYEVVHESMKRYFDGREFSARFENNILTIESDNNDYFHSHLTYEYHPGEKKFERKRYYEYDMQEERVVADNNYSGTFIAPENLNRELSWFGL